jgi:CubicO group peptidase (beta-lactamase class C family)
MTAATRLCPAVVAMIAFGCGAAAPASLDDEVARVDALIGAEVTRRSYPGLAVGLVRGGRLVWQAGYGAADASGVFRIGSVTKVITTRAIRQLCDAGRLRLDEPAATYLPELAGVLSPAGVGPVTVLHLVTHTSGIPTRGNETLDWTTGDHAITEAELIAALDGATASFAPGTRVEYSNVGMALAGLIVARVSGRPYRQYVTERILAPLAMTSSVWDRAAVPADRLVEGHARGPDSRHVPGGPHWRLGAMEAIGGLYSTVEDMARFAVVASRELATDAGSRIGWAVQTIPDLGLVAWHSGSTLDYGAWLGLALEHDTALVLLASSGDPADVEALAQLGARVLVALAP